MKKHNVKIFRSGNTIEIIEYGRPIINESLRDIRKGRSSSATNEDKLLNRFKVMKRARTNLRRLIEANSYQWRNSRGRPYKPVFITLTFAENVQDFDTANHEFKLFIMRLGNLVGGRESQNCLKYVVVPEFQKRGAIHYHLIIFNMPYIPAKKIADIWRNGFIKVNSIDNVDNIGAYVCKYMGKDLDDERLRGKKSYFSSRGLLKPYEIQLDTSTHEHKKMLEQLIQTAQANAVKTPYSVTYESDYFKSITYSQYTVNHDAVIKCGD